MNDIKKLVLAASNLLIVGAVTCGIGIGLSSSVSRETRVEIKLTEQEFVATDVDRLKGIDVDLTFEDVMIEASEEDDIVVKYMDYSAEPIYQIYENSGRLFVTKSGANTFSRGSLSVWDIAKAISKKDSITKGDAPVIIKVPERYKGKLDVDLVSGSARVSYMKIQDKMEINSVSGDVQIESVDVDGEIEIASISGNVSLNEVNGTKRQEYSTTSGTVKLNKVKTLDSISIDSVSGSQTCNEISVENIQCDTASGAVGLYGITVQDDLAVDSISGSVSVSIAEAPELYSVITDSTSGYLSLEKGEDQYATKEVNIHTVSGGITVKFVN